MDEIQELPEKNEDNKKRIADLKEALRDMEYRGIPVFNPLKLSLIGSIRRSHGFSFSWLKFLLGPARDLGWMIYEFLSLFLPGRDRKAFDEFGKWKAILVVDYERPDLQEMMKGLLDEFSEKDVCVVTVDRTVYEALKSRPFKVFLVADLLEAVRKESLCFGDYFKFIKIMLHVDLNFSIKLNLFRIFQKITKYIELYWALLPRTNARAVITLTDIQPHEHVIAAVANQLDIRTYTMQHGILGVAHLPITSKTIFAWGESSKEQLISWGYAPERIMVLGRLKVSDEIENDFLDRSEVRTQFSKKYQMDPNKLIVGYFATDWDEDLNYELFKFFSTTLTNDIQVYVKIRPHRDHSRYYEKWLAELAPNKRVPIITDMEVREFFCASDVIVTDISSAGAEALLFDNASVLLDIYDFMKLSNLPHYKDCVVARNSQDLNSFFKRIIDQPDYLASLKKEGLVNARRHFMRHPKGSPARFIADHIMAEIR